MKYETNQSENRTTVSVNRLSNKRRERIYITMVSEDTHADEKTLVSWAEWKKKWQWTTLSMTKKTKIPEQRQTEI